MDGHLQMSPLVEGQRVLVTTNAGVVRVFELSATDAKTPLREVAETAIEGGGQSHALRPDAERPILDRRQPPDQVRRAGRPRPSDAQVDRQRRQRLPSAAGGRRPSGRVGAAQVGNARRHRVGRRHAGIPTRSGKRGSPRRWPASRWSWADGKTTARSSPSPPTAACSGSTRTKRAGRGQRADRRVGLLIRIQQPVSHVVRLAGGLLAISGGKGGDQVGVFDPNERRLR